ncbi:MAG: NUDIX hydrolase [Paracoccaceae bacterium]|jgi:8-oxo-dGTP pyrophosphatase MutT (NUDIX family)|nr:NUDIX hydrolase [Paracoccaceae bacterium]MDE2692917.1 NUDIX hydrolase [Paracoccaceae bacterium]|tara:strand:- start:1455 stop:2123 length:669 start_codon:yes stop_codon:yes gene_type:complete
MEKMEIKNAATVILLRGSQKNPEVLMGQRGKNASFMPNKFVFPGGALDPGDSEIDFNGDIPTKCIEKLRLKADPSLAKPLIAAGIRELWEETGLILGSKSKTKMDSIPKNWKDFFALGYQPSADNIEFVFRAITPPGRTRRFDARFFLLSSDNIKGDLDDFSKASGELSHLQWIELNSTQNLDLPFITEIVLSEVLSKLKGNRNNGIPFYYHDSGTSHFLRL